MSDAKEVQYPPKELALTVVVGEGVWIAAGSKTPVYVKIKEVRGGENGGAQRVMLFCLADQRVKILREKLCDENGRPIVRK